MGSAPSSPNQNVSEDPWWSIEHQNFTLDQSPVQLALTVSLSDSENLSDQNRNIINRMSENSEGRGQNISNENMDNQTRDGSMQGNGFDIIEKDIPLDIEESSHSLELDNHESKKTQTLDEFREELRMKREQRHNAISDLRNEMSRLRQQLAAQKDINRELMRHCKNCPIAIDIDSADIDILMPNLPANDYSEDICSSSNELNHANVIGNTIDEINETAETKEETTTGAEDQQSSIADTNYDAVGKIALKSQLAEVQFALQLANAECISLTSELNMTKKQVFSLKEAISASKQMVEIREQQVNQLKGKLKEIEDSLGERELKIMSQNLRQEYDRQLSNIRNLRILYEERARVNLAERENLIRQLDTKRIELEAENENTKILQERIESLEAELTTTSNELIQTKEELSQYRSENKGLCNEMAVINKLFSQLLMGFNGGNDLNIDKLTNMLEDNRELLQDLTTKEACTEGAAALPKLLFDLVSQAYNDKEHHLYHEGIGVTVQSTDEVNKCDTESIELTEKSNVTSTQEIIQNLPKVWKVLVELLNHQKIEQVNFMEKGEGEDCYKSVQTPTGPQLVLSVSKTYIKLKDLILEKKFLQKETHKLKNLNSHLESRLNQQEQRLSAVTIELNKTWNLVGRMQRQHRQLHTQEQVLRYQLQQKRRMLTGLKDELEYCRRKWALAREKNNATQSQWNILRLEFTNRKLQDANNSAESGFSDDPQTDDENSDFEEKCTLTNRMNVETIKIDLLSNMAPKIIRRQSLSPIRSSNEKVIKRDSSAPPLLNEDNQPVVNSCINSYQTTSEIFANSETLNHIVASNVTNKDLGFASSSTVVVDNVCDSIINHRLCSVCTLKKPISLKAEEGTGSKLRLSRELRRRSVQRTDKKKNEESLEEMFNRLSGKSTTTDVETANIQEKSTFPEELCSQCKNVLEHTTEKEVESSTEIISETSPAIKKTNLLLSNDDDVASGSKLVPPYDTTIDTPFPTTSRDYPVNTDLYINTGGSHSSIDEENSSSRTRIDSININNNTDQPSNALSESNLQIGSTNSVPNLNENVNLTESERVYLDRREERLRRLEEQSAQLMTRMTQSASRATDISSQLDRLHTRYSNVEEATQETTESQPESQNDVVREESEDETN